MHYCVDGKPHPEVEKQLLVYVGLNSKNVEDNLKGTKKEENEFRSKHEFDVEKAYTPSKWNGIKIFFKTLLLKYNTSLICLIYYFILSCFDF